MKKFFLLLVLLCLTLFSFPVSADEFDDYTPISTAEELDAIRYDLSGKYYLTNNIVFEDSDFKKGGSFYNDGVGWLPIGDLDHPFSGVLCGNGFEIENLTQNTDSFVTGLVGCNSGEIYDLTLKNVNLAAKYELNGSTSSSCHFGTIVGWNTGLVRDCYSSGKLVLSAKNSTIANLKVYCGGICGCTMTGDIYDCLNDADIDLSVSRGSVTYQVEVFVGGIVGQFGYGEQILKNCVNFGDINVNVSGTYGVGGIVGKSSCEIQYCVNNGDLFAKSDGSHATNMIGGISGSSEKNVLNSYNSGNIEGACYSDARVYGGGISGQGSGRIGGCLNDGDVCAMGAFYQSSAYAGGVIGKSRRGVEKCGNNGTVVSMITEQHVSVSMRSLNGYAYAAGISAWDEPVSYAVDESIVDCYNSGIVATKHMGTSGSTSTFGIVSIADAYTKIENCYNVGEISSELKNDRELDECYLGAILAPHENSESLKEETCFYLDSVKAGTGIISDFGVFCTADEMKTKETFATFDFDSVWEMNHNGDYLYPLLQCRDLMGHRLTEIPEKSANCTSTGEEKHWKCNDCNVLYGDPIGLTVLEKPIEIPCGHVWDEGKVIAKPTVKEEGEILYTCIECKITKSESVPKLEVDVSFVDVPIDSWYSEAVYWAVSEGITNGTSATTFSPDANCTRAQMVTFLWRALGTPERENDLYRFSDVVPGNYYFDAVYWAEERGITTGTSAMTFSPDNEVTRAQVVTFLWREAGCPEVNVENPFNDLVSGTYYYTAVLWAVENGITTGISEGVFAPDEICTRSQIVTFLYRYF